MSAGDENLLVILDLDDVLPAAGETVGTGGLVEDKDGEIVVTKLDEEMLREVAKAGNGAYVHAGNDEFGLNPIIDDVRRMEDEELGSVVFEDFDEQYMYFFGIALALLVVEMLIGERRPKKEWFDK